MAQFKCKMCGGTIEVQNNQTTCVCEFCGTTQTVPQVIDNLKITSLHNRANSLRMKNEFDKAMLTYENIVNECPTDAEAHWGLLLCRYGIEYVDDPKTGKKIPTCHRTQLKSIFDDIDYKAAIENSDVVAKRLYQAEAETINKIQKGILAVSQNEKPYDIFICYKENDEYGKRTRDSVIAQELYEELTRRNYKVFFAKVTLESKLGTQYEPYIFAALNSSKVMLVLGTKPEYFNAVWVKNEWSRFLSLMNKDKNKYLIPCFRNMDAYELPDELLSFQAQDMNRLGFIQDITRGIDKIFDRSDSSQSVVQNVNIQSLLRRAEILINDKNYEKASGVLDEALNKNPENARAYILSLVVDLRLSNENELVTVKIPLTEFGNFKKALEFADEDYKAVLEEYNQKVLKNIEIDNFEKIYAKGVVAKNNNLFEQAILLFNEIPNFSDAQELIKECEIAIKEKNYLEATSLIENKEFKKALKILETIKDYKDVESLIEKCKLSICDINYDIAKKFIEKKMYDEAINELSYIKDYKDVNYLIALCNDMILNEKETKYKKALRSIENYKFDEAIKILSTITNYKDSYDKLELANSLRNNERIYQNAIKSAQIDKISGYTNAIKILNEIKDYRDSKQLIENFNDQINDIKTRNAIRKDKVKRGIKIGTPIMAGLIVLIILTCTLFIPLAKYGKAMRYLSSGDYDNAQLILEDLGDFSDAKNQISIVKANKSFEAGDYETGIDYIYNIGGVINVTYDGNGGTPDNETTIIKKSKYIEDEASCDEEGYSFHGWILESYDVNNAKNKYSADLTLKASWEAIKYTITYNLDGGTLLDAPEYYIVEEGVSIPNPTRVGYTFLGWTEKNSDFEPTLNLKIESGTIGNKEYLAHWKENEYTIYFNENGGEEKIDSMTVSFGCSYSLPIPTRTGYTFDGWFYNGTKVRESTWSIPNDCELVAKWVANTNTPFTVNYYQENLDGEFTLMSKSILKGKTDDIVSPQPIVFDGFVTPSIQSVKILPDGSAVVDYYYYRIINSVTFVSNGGTEVETIYLKYGSEVDKSIKSTRAGFTFDNWYIDVDLMKEFDFKIGSTELVVYAHWLEEEKPFAFEYTLNDEYCTINKYNEVGKNKCYIPKYIGGKEVRFLDDTVFSGKTNVREVVIPNTIVEFGVSVFYNCKYLETVIFEDESKLEIIGHYAFYGCESLTSIQIPYGVNYIGIEAFYNCVALENILFEDDCKLDKIGDYLFYGCNSLISITIPRNVTSIGSYAFSGCNNLTTIIFENGSKLETIYNHAFYKCSSIDSLELPNCLKVIGDHAFYNCKKIETIIFADESKLEKISDFAFYNCDLITSIIIPKSIKNIDGHAFYSCANLIIYCEMESIPSDWDSYWNNNRPVYLGVTKDKLITIDNMKYVIVDESVVLTEYISDASNNITIPDFINHNGINYYVYGIGEQVFYNNENLETIVLPNTITFIGNSAFYGCSSLSSISTLDNLVTIGNSAFYECQSLTSFNISKSVISIGGSAFYMCKKLQSITIDKESKLEIIEGSTFRGCSSLISFELPNSIARIGNYAFENCKEMRTFTINTESKLEDISVSAFSGCSALVEITIPNGVDYIGTDAFRGCESITSIILPNSVRTMGDRVFMKCTSLTYIFIPNSVTEMGIWVFIGCNSLSIYCEAESVPSGWGDRWNVYNLPVYWGASLDN
ncbi:MAG: leucine-rich repeat protein [Erysipelotrichales bacterium]|nr:leucine-rich repeat protein [Erysipelotrichales bacterium]